MPCRAEGGTGSKEKSPARWPEAPDSGISQGELLLNVRKDKEKFYRLQVGAR